METTTLGELLDRLNAMAKESPLDAPVFVKVDGAKKQRVWRVDLARPIPQIPGSENQPFEVIMAAGEDRGVR